MKKYRTRIDTDRMRGEIGPSEFRETLAYYGIRPDAKGKFICPFHNDRHVGNCGVMNVNPAKGHCYACGKYFDSVDLVKLNEGIDENWKAMQFLWTDILGRQLPTVSEDVSTPKLSGGDYEFLGLSGLSLKSYDEPPILDVCGETYRKSDLPEGMEFFEELADVESDTCPYGRRIKAPAAQELAKSDPDFFFTMLENKANEKMIDLLQLRSKARGTDGSQNAPSTLQKYAFVVSSLMEPAYPGITQQVMPMVSEIWAKKADEGIARVNQIAKKIRSMEAFYKWKPSYV